MIFGPADQQDKSGVSGRAMKTNYILFGDICVFLLGLSHRIRVGHRNG